jgi:N6-adenosine-specific RNA methylase IME4
VTNNFLPDGLAVMRAWDFRYVTVITWAKDKIGLGQYFRGQTEQCLFGVRGNPGYRLVNGGRCQGTTLITAPRGQHSAKPAELRHMIERVSPGPYLELFAREQAAGWDCWGNEVVSAVSLAHGQMELAL